MSGTTMRVDGHTDDSEGVISDNESVGCLRPISKIDFEVGYCKFNLFYQVINISHDGPHNST